MPDIAGSGPLDMKPLGQLANDRFNQTALPFHPRQKPLAARFLHVAPFRRLQIESLSGQPGRQFRPDEAFVSQQHPHEARQFQILQGIALIDIGRHQGNMPITPRSSISNKPLKP